MRTLARILPLAILTLPGCIFHSQPPRTYTYDIDLRNTTGRDVSVELLRIDSTKVTKTRCDLAAGGFYANRFTTLNSAEYLEARLRFLDDPDTAPRYLAELQRESFRRDIVAKDNRLLLADRPNAIPDPK